MTESKSPFTQASTDENHIPKHLQSPENTGKTPEQIAAEEAAKAASAAANTDENTPEKIFGEEYKEKKWEDVKTDFHSSRQKLADYETKMKELSEKQPEFADPVVAEYNAWIKNGGDKDFAVFSAIRSLDGNTLDEIDAIVTQRVIENPKFKGLEAQLKQELITQYQLESTTENPLTEDQIKFNRAKIGSEADKAKEFLSGLKSKMQVQQPDPEAATKAIQKQKEAWTPIIEKVFKDFKSVPIALPKKDEQGKIVKDDKGNVSFDEFEQYQVPDHLQARYKELYTENVHAFGSVNEKSEQSLKAALYNKFIVDNMPYMIDHALQKQKVELDAFYEKKYGGGFVPKGPGGNPNAGSKSTKETMTKFQQTINA